MFKIYGQLENRYPNGLSDEILGNADTIIDMGINDIYTASYFCKLIGIATAETTSIKKSNSLEGDIEEYGQKNISTVKRNLLNEDEIIRLSKLQLIVKITGNLPLLIDKIIYTEHFLFKKLKDSPINEYNPKWIKNVAKISKKIDVQKITKQEKEISWDTF